MTRSCRAGLRWLVLLLACVQSTPAEQVPPVARRSEDVFTAVVTLSEVPKPSAATWQLGIRLVPELKQVDGLTSSLPLVWRFDDSEGSVSVQITARDFESLEARFARSDPLPIRESLLAFLLSKATSVTLKDGNRVVLESRREGILLPPSCRSYNELEVGLDGGVRTSVVKVICSPAR